MMPRRDDLQRIPLRIAVILHAPEEHRIRSFKRLNTLDVVKVAIVLNVVADSIKEKIGAAAVATDARHLGLLGPHDGFVIVEVPDAVGMAAVSALVAASGAYAHVETHALLTPPDLVAALGRAGAAAARFTAPGSAAQAGS